MYVANIYNSYINDYYINDSYINDNDSNIMQQIPCCIIFENYRLYKTRLYNNRLYKNRIFVTYISFRALHHLCAICFSVVKAVHCGANDACKIYRKYYNSIGCNSCGGIFPYLSRM